MKGLIIKDFRLLIGQKKFFLGVIAIALSIALLMQDASFIIGYIMIVIPMFSLSTISYDEFDNGNAFLFTLPVSRWCYVIEKYCFSILLSVSSMFLAFILTTIVSTVNGFPEMSEFIMAVLIAFVATLFMQAVMIPVQLKFGSEKGRIAMIATVGIAITLGNVIVQLLNKLGMDIVSIVNGLQSLNLAILTALVSVVTIILLLISVKISIAVIMKKEF